MNEQNLKKNMIWNAAGNLIYLMCQWLVTVLVTNIGAFRDAGLLSVAMSVSATFQTVAMFGIRNYQVSDVDNKYSDTCYVSLRVLTCAVALIACLAFSLISGYTGEQLLAVALFMLFRLAENFSDVLHGIAQKSGRLDIAGKAFAIKGVGLVTVFLTAYQLSSQLCVGLLAMALFSIGTTFLYDLLAVKRLSDFKIFEANRKWRALALETAPLCLYLFFSAAIGTIPKLILEWKCGEEILGAYSSIFAPALLIAAATGYLYTPFIPMFANAYREKRNRAFLGLFAKLGAAIACLALLSLLAAWLLGDFALKLIFGEKILAYAYLLIPILIFIFANALFAFLCMLEVVLRDFWWLLFACGSGLLAEILLTGVWIEKVGINATSYSLTLGSALPSLIMLVRIMTILRKKRKET